MRRNRKIVRPISRRGTPTGLKLEQTKGGVGTDRTGKDVLGNHRDKVMENHRAHGCQFFWGTVSCLKS